MFKFLLSADLVRKIIDNIKHEDPAFAKKVADIGVIDIEQLRTQWGRTVVACMGSAAQYTRHLSAESFEFIKDGAFDKHTDESLGGQICIPTGEAGDMLMREVAAEFVQHMLEHNPTDTLHPKTPITKIVVEGNTVIAHVRPKDPPFRDPNFVQATIVE